LRAQQIQTVVSGTASRRASSIGELQDVQFI
jgi:hypothetical protein